ncbi:MAG: leucine-rich repeat protein, partial [Ruminococcus sp.]
SNITIPKQVKQIGVRAFARCTKLKTVNVKSTSLNMVGLDAFKIINKTPTFNLPKSKLKTCKKLIKPNAPSKAKFVGKF